MKIKASFRWIINMKNNILTNSKALGEKYV